MRKRFEFGIMRCHQRRNFAFEQMHQNGARQCRPFNGIRPRPQFVQQNERMFIGLVQNVRDIFEMRGKRGKRLFDGLFIANIGIDAGEDRQTRAGTRGNV